MDPFSLIIMLSQVAISLLQSSHVISSGTAQVASTIDTAVGALKNAVTSNTGVNAEAAASLAAVNIALEQLKLDPSLPADVLARIEVLSDGIQAALAADQEAQVQVDPENLTPIEPLS